MRVPARRALDQCGGARDLAGRRRCRQAQHVEVVDRVVADRIPAADHTRERGIGLDEVAGEEERRRGMPSAQGEQDASRTIGVPTAVEGQRDHVLSGLQPDDLPGDDRGRQREAHASPGSRTPAARSRSAGTGSAAGCATSSTAP